MIIDLSLDRRDGVAYDPVLFAFDVNDYSQTWPDLAGPILAALSSKCEQTVKQALCGYIQTAGYNPDICDYINSVNWLPSRYSLD